MPSNGFSVGYLQSVLGQAKGYLRPLQRDIEMDTRQEGVASPEKVCQLSSPRPGEGGLPYKSDGDALHSYLEVYIADFGLT